MQTSSKHYIVFILHTFLHALAHINVNIHMHAYACVYNQIGHDLIACHIKWDMDLKILNIL